MLLVYFNYIDSMNRNYGEVINIEDFWDKRLYFSQERGNITFYCKDCKDIVKTERISNWKYIFTCIICWWENISIGTEEWIKEMYKLKK